MSIDMTNWIMKEHNVPNSFLTVLEKTDKRTSRGEIIWRCQCECGNIIELDGTTIRRGKTKSCGCKRTELQLKSNSTFINSGTQFEKLIVLSILPHTTNRVKYLCKCECGNIVEVYGTDLQQKRTRSCGCLAKDIRRQRLAKDYTGQRFGKLVVLEKINSIGRAIYKCQCDCGNICEIEGRYLTRQKEPYRSCGCSHKSIGENNIEQILKENDIDYIRDKIYFKDLINNNGNIMRYDFILLQNNIPYRLIEFDGEQHFHIVNKGYMSGEEHFLQQIASDNLKNNYAHSHNIPLVRIPYKERDNITLEMLMSDKYLVT